MRGAYMKSEWFKSITLCVIGLLCSCAPGPHQPESFKGSGWATHGPVDYFNRLHAFTVGPNSTYNLTQITEKAAELVANAEVSVDVALEHFESPELAQYLVEAAARGIAVRVIGDVDRRAQDGFQILESAGVEVIYGDGAVTWQAVFGRELVQRTGEDNLMTHNFIIADRLRILNLTGGFALDADDAIQAGFIAASEDLAKDFGDCFDQLHGGIFATAQTFYDDSVSADTNNRTSYPIEDGVVEVYFGPQERLVKEVIDRIYAAKASVHIAATQLKNREMARALRYKAQAGFDVKIVLGGPAALPMTGIDEIRSNSAVDSTIIVLDGQAKTLGGLNHPGSVMVLSMPLFEAVPYYFDDAGEEDPLPQPSDRFTDANMWVIDQNVVNPSQDYQVLAESFGNLFESGVPQ
jgi:phosphatidylserine/phosphatidylglycerophosphate/cardiolipin synthase-like enzyme